MINRWKQLVVVLGTILVVAGCGSNPSDTAEKFLGNIAEGKVTEAGEFATQNTANMLAAAQALGALPVNPDFDFQFVKEEIDGKKATVTYKSKEDGRDETIHLVQLDGKWKVHEQKK